MTSEDIDRRQGQGQPLPPHLAGLFAPRLGADLSGVRLHTDSAAASRASSLHARAFATGPDIYFGPNQYQPGTASGRGLLAHELTHVVQQARGRKASPTIQEQEARRVEDGGSLHIGKQGPPRATIQLSGQVAVRLTILVDSGTDGAARFEVELEDGQILSGRGSVTGLDAGTYRVEMGTGTTMVITSADGSAIPETTRFSYSIPNDVGMHAALQGVRQPIPMIVASSTSERPSGSDSDGAGTSNSSSTTTSTEPPPLTPDEARAQLETLPERVRDFLFSQSGMRIRDEDYVDLLRIARRLEGLTDEELAEYRARTTATTLSLARFERSIERWIVEVRERRAAEIEYEEATRTLFGLDEVYDFYQRWLARPMDRPSWVRMAEGLATEELTECPGSLGQMYCDLRQMLQPHGFENVTAFELAIQRFIETFRAHANFQAREMLDRYEHLLRAERSRYRDPEVLDDLYQRLDLPRMYFEYADQIAAEARANHGSGFNPADVMEFHREGMRQQRIRARGLTTFEERTEDQPILGNPDFGHEELARASRDEIGGLLQSYIRERLQNIANTRENLDGNPDMVFDLDILMARNMAHQGIEPGSIWARIIENHQRPTTSERVRDIALIVLAVGAGLLSGGTGTIAVLAGAASLGFSAYLAVQEYEAYSLRSDAYGAQLLAEEPSMGWLIVALGAVALDAVIVGRVLTPVRAFQRSGDIVSLERQLRLVDISDQLRRNILAGAEIELRSRRAWASILRPSQGVLRASVFGADVFAQVVYAVALSMRRGINSFNRWRLTNEAIDLIGDISRLNAQELVRLKEIYGRAATDARRIIDHGQSRRMTPDDIDSYLLSWAHSGSGTADDVIRRMTQREVVIDRTLVTGPVTRSTLPRGHHGGVRILGPDNSYIQLLPLDEFGRSRGVVAHVNAELLAQGTGSSASGRIVGRSANQDRGHLLANCLGGPDLPQNLAPLYSRVNQREMRMAEVAIRDSIREGGEATITVVPIYREARQTMDPEAFLMSVRRRDGSQDVFRFANP